MVLDVGSNHQIIRFFFGGMFVIVGKTRIVHVFCLFVVLMVGWFGLFVVLIGLLCKGQFMDVFLVFMLHLLGFNC